MRTTIVVAIASLAMTVATATAETIKFRCTLQTTPKSEAEDYVVDTEDNTVTVILRDVHGNILSSKTHPVTVSDDAFEWTLETAGKLKWKQRYDRAKQTLTSSNSAGESFVEKCKDAR